MLSAPGIFGGDSAKGLGRAGLAVVGRNDGRRQSVHRVHRVRETTQVFSVDATGRGSLESAHRPSLEALGVPTVLVNVTGGNSPWVTAERPFEVIEADDWHANSELIRSAAWFCAPKGAVPPVATRLKGVIRPPASPRTSPCRFLSRVVAYSALKCGSCKTSPNSLCANRRPKAFDSTLLLPTGGAPAPRNHYEQNFIPITLRSKRS